MKSPSPSALAVSAVVVGVLAVAALSLRAEEERSQNWYTFCAFCHGEDGKAKTDEGKKNGARDLTNAKWQETVSDERLFHSITKGRGKMPTFEKKLSPDEIRALVREVRSLAGRKR